MNAFVRPFILTRRFKSTTIDPTTNLISIYSRVCDNGYIEPAFIKVISRNGGEQQYSVEKRMDADGYKFKNIKTLPVTKYTYN
jgi:hypothetical protein